MQLWCQIVKKTWVSTTNACVRQCVRSKRCQFDSKKVKEWVTLKLLSDSEVKSVLTCNRWKVKLIFLKFSAFHIVAHHLRNIPWKFGMVKVEKKMANACVRGANLSFFDNLRSQLHSLQNLLQLWYMTFYSSFKIDRDRQRNAFHIEVKNLFSRGCPTAAKFSSGVNSVEKSYSSNERTRFQVLQVETHFTNVFRVFNSS